MENRINVADLLKYCPKGMELDCTIFDNVTFEGIKQDKYPIIVKLKEPSMTISLTETGGWNLYDSAKCVIFPKGKTSWEGFQRPFKDGDIVFYNDTIAIFKEWGDETLFKTYVTKYLQCDSLIDTNVPLFGKSVRKEIRFATEEEKQKLFDAIRVNGFRWNAETKTLEKLIDPKFKVGDKVQHKGATSCCSVYDVEKMQWVGNHIEFTIGRLWYNNCCATVTEEDLQPYKEETIEKISIIWQTGEPTISGSYLITIKEDFVTCGYYCTIKGWSNWNDDEITAWCRLKDIKPYKKQ